MSKFELFDNLMHLCETTEASKFFFKDFKGPAGSAFRVFSYHYASYSDWLVEGALESRGIMFELDDNSKPIRIACRPMTKFFNLNENPLTMNLDLTKIKYSMDKADGSLVSTYIDGGYLYIKSKTSLFSEQAVAASRLINGPEYNDIREKILHFAELDYTFNFEYVAPDNRIVLSYSEPKLILLNVRHNETGEYVEYEDLFADPVFRKFLVKSYAVDNPDEWVKEVRAAEGIEGFVAVLEDGTRFKLKSEWYCALHNTKDSVTSNEKLFVSIVASASDDLRSMFAGDDYFITKINIFESIYLKYLDSSINVVMSFYKEWAGRERKDYAIAAKETTKKANMEYVFGTIMSAYSGELSSEAMLESLEKVFLKNWKLFVPSEYEKEIVNTEE